MSCELVVMLSQVGPLPLAWRGGNVREVTRAPHAHASARHIDYMLYDLEATVKSFEYHHAADFATLAATQLPPDPRPPGCAVPYIPTPSPRDSP